MYAHKGDKLLRHGRIVGQHDEVGEILEVLGSDGGPPFRVRFEDGHEGVVSPGPDSVILAKTAEPPGSHRGSR